MERQLQSRLPMATPEQQQQDTIVSPSGDATADLMKATLVNDIAWARRLLAADGLDVDTRDSAGWTPLMMAAERGRVAIAQVLLEYGADPNATAEGTQSATALHFAAIEGHTAMAQLLVHGKAYIDARTLKGFTPLVFAVGEQHELTVRRLLELQASADAEDNLGDTALMCAIRTGQGDTSIVHQLLAADAMVDLRNNRGQTALTVAHEEEHESIARLLRPYISKLQLQVRDPRRTLQ